MGDCFETCTWPSDDKQDMTEGSLDKGESQLTDKFIDSQRKEGEAEE